MHKFIVCGSKNFREKEFLFEKLDYVFFNMSLKNIIIIQGGQKSYDKHLDVYYGADYFAKLWAKKRGAKCLEFTAPWGDFLTPLKNN